MHRIKINSRAIFIALTCLFYTSCGCQKKIEHRVLPLIEPIFIQKNEPPFKAEDIDVSFVLHGKQYVGSQKFWFYDPLKDTWEEDKNMTLPANIHLNRKNAVAWVYEQKVYICSGISKDYATYQEDYKKIYCFNGKKWEKYESSPGTTESLIYSNQNLSIFTLKNKSYSNQLHILFRKYITSFKENISKNSSEKSFKIPQAVDQAYGKPAIFLLDNKVYILNIYPNGSIQEKNNFYVFDPSKKKIEKRQDFPAAAAKLQFSTAFATIDRGYVGLGHNVRGTLSNTDPTNAQAFYQYDAKKDQWRKCQNTMPQKRNIDSHYTPLAFSIGKKRYILFENQNKKMSLYKIYEQQ